MTKPDDEITVVQVQGLSKISKKKMTVEEYLVPQPPSGLLLHCLMIVCGGHEVCFLITLVALWHGFCNQVL
jgi:hypothetical protein